MKVWLQAPSKTFLAGEYAVLRGEPGLVLCTEPHFKMSFEKNEEGTLGFAGIHPQSPAGLYLRKAAAVFENWGGEFEDPHEGTGGFGASSAQFLFVATLKRWIESNFENSNAQMPLDLLLEAYLGLHSQFPIAPSGVDVLAQAMGGIALIDRSKNQTRSFKWNFKDLDFLIVKTRTKVTTHDALQQVSKAQADEAREIVADLVQAIETRDSQFFVLSVLEYKQWLSSGELVHDNTRELLLNFVGTEVLAAKGCGAMGADTLLLVFHPDDKNKVLQRLPGLHLQPVAGSKDLTSGLQISFERGLGVNP